MHNANSEGTTPSECSTKHEVRERNTQSADSTVSSFVYSSAQHRGMRPNLIAMKNKNSHIYIYIYIYIDAYIIIVHVRVHALVSLAASAARPDKKREPNRQQTTHKQVSFIDIDVGHRQQKRTLGLFSAISNFCQIVI